MSLDLLLASDQRIQPPYQVGGNEVLFPRSLCGAYLRALAPEIRSLTHQGDQLSDQTFHQGAQEIRTRFARADIFRESSPASEVSAQGAFHEMELKKDQLSSEEGPDLTEILRRQILGLTEGVLVDQGQLEDQHPAGIDVKIGRKFFLKISGADEIREFYRKVLGEAFELSKLAHRHESPVYLWSMIPSLLTFIEVLSSFFIPVTQWNPAFQNHAALVTLTLSVLTGLFSYPMILGILQGAVSGPKLAAESRQRLSQIDHYLNEEGMLAERNWIYRSWYGCLSQRLLNMIQGAADPSPENHEGPAEFREVDFFKNPFLSAELKGGAIPTEMMRSVLLGSLQKHYYFDEILMRNPETGIPELFLFIRTTHKPFPRRRPPSGRRGWSLDDLIPVVDAE